MPFMVFDLKWHKRKDTRVMANQYALAGLKPRFNGETRDEKAGVSFNIQQYQL